MAAVHPATAASEGGPVGHHWSASWVYVSICVCVLYIFHHKSERFWVINIHKIDFVLKIFQRLSFLWNFLAPKFLHEVPRESASTCVCGGFSCGWATAGQRLPSCLLTIMYFSHCMQSFLDTDQTPSGKWMHCSSTAASTRSYPGLLCSRLSSESQALYSAHHKQSLFEQKQILLV